jgi:hypothetical protein
MTSDDWFFADNVRAARDAMHTAHARFHEIESSGASSPDFGSAASEAIRAEAAYFRLVPAHRYDAERGDPDEWDLAEAETSRLEGFTPGDSG